MELRIFIAENAPLVRERMVQLIGEEAGMSVIGYTGSAPDARAAILASRPEVALLDMHLQHGNAFQLLEALHGQALPTRLVLLTSSPYPNYRSKALQLGACELLDKRLLGESLLPLLRQLKEELA